MEGGQSPIEWQWVRLWFRYLVTQWGIGRSDASRGGSTLRAARERFLPNPTIPVPIRDAGADPEVRAPETRESYEIISEKKWSDVVQHDSARAARSTRKERLERLAIADPMPSLMYVQVRLFRRNQDVIAEVLERAAGHCEGCLAPAPFVRAKDGTPFLEVHHKIRLADGGLDTVENAVALCPNCHRRRHFGAAVEIG